MFKISKPDTPSKCCKEKRFEIEEHFFQESQLIDVENDDISEEENLEDVKLEDINVAMLEKKKRL